MNITKLKAQLKEEIADCERRLDGPGGPSDEATLEFGKQVGLERALELIEEQERNNGQG